MVSFSGNTSTSATSVAKEISTKIKSFSLTNKSGGGITVNASILYGSTNIWITPLNKALAAGEIYTDDREIVVPKGASIYVLVNGGNCDYYFTIE